MNKILRFKYLLRKWQSFRGKKPTTNPTKKPHWLWQVLGLLKFSSVVVQVKSSEISRDVSVLCCRNRQSEFDVCTLPDSSQVLELASPAFHLSVLSVSLLHYSGVGFALHFVWNAKGKGNRNSCTNTGAGPWAQLCWFAVCWENARGFFLPSPPHGIFGPESKGEMLTQPCMHPVCPEHGRIVLSKLGGVYDYFLIVIFLWTPNADLLNECPRRWAVCSGLWLAGSAFPSHEYFPVQF